MPFAHTDSCGGLRGGEEGVKGGKGEGEAV